jgi:hypothetical protein
VTDARDPPCDGGRSAAAPGFAREKRGEGRGCGTRGAEVAGVTPAAEEFEVAAVGASAGRGFFGAGEFEREGEFVGGQFGSDNSGYRAQTDRCRQPHPGQYFRARRGIEIVGGWICLRAGRCKNRCGRRMGDHPSRRPSATNGKCLLPGKGRLHATGSWRRCINHKWNNHNANRTAGECHAGRLLVLSSG